MNALEYSAAGAAAIVAGALNALVGGGTLVTFPTLLALGVPPVAANVTNTVALCSGYLSGAVAQREGLRDQRNRVLRLGGVAVVGGFVGAALLLVTSDDLLRLLVPVLLGLATVLLALQPRLRELVGRAGTPHDEGAGTVPDATWLPFAVGLVAVYGGFFGAGLGVMMLATLGIGVHLPLNRSNAIKQILQLVINVSAAVFFLFSGKVWWGLAAVMAVGSTVGGAIGGKFVGRLSPATFRAIVVAIGSILTIYYAVKVIA